MSGRANVGSVPCDLHDDDELDSRVVVHVPCPGQVEIAITTGGDGVTPMYRLEPLAAWALAALLVTARPGGRAHGEAPMTHCPACGKSFGLSEADQATHDLNVSHGAPWMGPDEPETFGPYRCCSPECSDAFAWLLEEDPAGARRLSQSYGVNLYALPPPLRVPGPGRERLG